MQFLGKLLSQTWKNDKKPTFGPDFDLLGPNLGPKKFWRVLPLLVVRHCSKLSSYALYRKNNKPNLRKCQKNPTNFGPDFGPNLVTQNCFVRFTSTRRYTLLQAIIVCNLKENWWAKLEKMAKNLVSCPILAPLAQFFVDFTSTRC